MPLNIDFAHTDFDKVSFFQLKYALFKDTYVSLFQMELLQVAEQTSLFINDICFKLVEDLKGRFTQIKFVIPEVWLLHLIIQNHNPCYILSLKMTLSLNQYYDFQPPFS